MAVVFVSHASADKALVDEFVDTILRNGSDLSPKEIFYSSGADTSVPDGKDLLGYVRDQVGGTGLVVTILTPTFQTRPVCVAEMGAAWGSTGKLFPLLVPGLKRAELEGVLSTQLVEYMDDEGALDRLHSKITDITGRRVDAATWTRAKRKWLKRVKEIIESGGVPMPQVVTAEEHAAVMAERDRLLEALDCTETEIDALKSKLAEVASLKDHDEVAAIMLPTDAAERFEHLVTMARYALNDVGNSYVAQAIVGMASSAGGLMLPGDQWDRDQIFEAVDKGLLIDGDGIYHPSDDFAAHEAAQEAVDDAIVAADDYDPGFIKWFTMKYGAKPNLSNPTVLKKVFLD